MRYAPPSLLRQWIDNHVYDTKNISTLFFGLSMATVYLPFHRALAYGYNDISFINDGVAEFEHIQLQPEYGRVLQ
jgi:hypothetical protein